MLGIDLNGLCDVCVDQDLERVYRGGDVPSVVIARPKDGAETLRIIAGREAAQAIEGRGWIWPASAQGPEDSACLRIPVRDILQAVLEGREHVAIAGTLLSPLEPLGEIIGALTLPRQKEANAGHDRRVVLAIPDNGQLLEEQRQQFIDAARLGNVSPTLLWRPVAALLGMAHQLSDVIDRLARRRHSVGVLSCLDDGVHAARLEIEVVEDAEGHPQMIPLRRRSGIMVPYRRTVSELATELAQQIASGSPRQAWQLQWGDGLVFRWLLRMADADAVLQSERGWQVAAGKRPKDLPELSFDDEAMARLNNFLDGVDFILPEGPALEVHASGTRLLYHLRENVAPGAHSLTSATQGTHLAARGCVVYLQRQARNHVTHYDHLPQMQLAVLRDSKPIFLPLINDTERQVGGRVYEKEHDLGLSIGQGSTQLEFYLLREGSAKPRHVSVELTERLSETVPVKLRIRQQPAQGLARLTLIGASKNVRLRPVELHWSQMTEEDLTKEEVLARLTPPPVRVPPVQPQPCHVLMWTAARSLEGNTLAEDICRFQALVQSSEPDLSEINGFLGTLSSHLTRRSSPWIMTKRDDPDRTLFRAVSSDGELPVPEDGLDRTTLECFNSCLDDLDRLVASTDLFGTTPLSAAVRLGGWCFTTCPTGIRQHLLDAAKNHAIPDARNYYRAMGKIFDRSNEFRAYFSLLEAKLASQDGTFSIHLMEGLFYLLSLREHAPRHLTGAQASLFANKIADRIEEQLRQNRKRALSRLINTSIKTLAGLLRYRLVDPDFMSSDDGSIGSRLHRLLDRLSDQCHRFQNKKLAALAEDLSKWAENQGDNPSILIWDGDDQDPYETE